MVRKSEPGEEDKYELTGGTDEHDSLTETSEESYGDHKDSKDDVIGRERLSSEKVNRRAILKSAGVAAMAGAFSTEFVGLTSGASYDTITLDSGEMRQVKLGDGDTFANKLIDQRADNCAFSIKAEGDNWTIKNVGFLGAAAWDEFNFHMRVGCPDGGSGLIENVYANNKQEPNEPMGMVWEQPDHSGHITMRHTYIEGFGNNAGYFTNSNKRDRAGGTVTYNHCYHVDNTPANFRPGGDGSLVKGCVSVVDDPDHERAYYTDGESDKSRPTWPSHTKGIKIENTSFYTNKDDVNPGAYFSLRHEDISNGDKCEVTAVDLAVDCAGNLAQSDSLFEAHEGNTNLIVENYQQGEQTVDVLGEGVPLDAKMAAKGERDLPPELPGGSDDGGSDVSAIQYDGDATAVHKSHYDTDDSAGIEFSVTNSADYELTVTHVTVSPQDSSINELHDESDAVGRWVSEVHIDADSQDGVCDVPGSASLPNTFDMANDGWDDSADEVAIMSSGSAASLALSRFEDDGTPIDMAGKSVDISIDFELSNGDTGTDSFTLDVGDSNSSPVVDSLSVSEVETSDSDAEFDVDWSVSDSDGNLDSVDLTLTDDTDSETEDTATVSVSGDAASGTTRLVAAGDNESGNSYTVELTVTDSDGASSTDSVSVTESEAMQYEGDAVAVHKSHYPSDDRAGVEFSMTNLTDQELTVTHIAVSPQDSSVNELHDESNDLGRWVSEVHVDADTQKGICDVSGSSALPNTFDMANDGWDDSADSVAIMSAGSTASVALSRFEDDGAGVDMAGKSVDVGIDYELSDGDTGTELFTLNIESPDNSPTVDKFEVTEAGSADPDANILVDWAVSDADGDLATVDVEVFDGSGNVVDSASTSVSGDVAYDVDYFEIKNVDGQTFDVRITVTDDAGNQSSATKSVQE